MTIKRRLNAILPLTFLLPFVLLLVSPSSGNAPAQPRQQPRREPRKLFRLGNEFIDRTGRVVLRVGGPYSHPSSRDGQRVRPDALESSDATDDDGSSLRHPKILNVGDFSDGLAKFLVDTRPGSRRLFPAYGFMDETGAIVIPARGWRVENFQEGRALVRGEQYGYIDRTGAFVIPPRFALAYPFHEGLALACVEREKCGYIDRDGQTIVPFIYYGGTHFSEGLAHVYQKEKPVGFIDRAGKITIRTDSREYHANGMFSEGLASVRAGNKLGYIDRTGRLVIPAEFDEAREFSEGKALVSKDGAWGFIDRAGRVVVPLKYAYASSFSEGLAAVTTSRDRTVPGWGYIDHAGRVRIPTRFDFAAPFDGGLAAVDLTPDGQSIPDAYIDKAGRIVWEKRRR